MAESITRIKIDSSQYEAGARRFKNCNKEMETSLGKFKNSARGIAEQLGMVTTALGAMGLAAGAIRNNIETAREFEKSMSQLSSLTGMVGDDLKALSDEAIRLGSTTTQSASQVADAFKLIGSQKPELLGSKDALVAVSQSAITLAEAAGIEVPQAASALTGALNQFGMSGAEAERVINALAAGSQKGAGDIDYLNTAIAKCGTAANASKLSFEETVGAIEILAERIPDASAAGTNLRNILITLTTKAQDEFNPAVVGMQKAIDNLRDANLSAAEMTKLFGKENYNAAMILIEGADKCRNMTEAVTGTDTAMAQAKINTNNFDGAVLSLQSAWEGFNLTLNRSNGMLTAVVNNLATVVTGATQAIAALDKITTKQGILNYIGGNLKSNGAMKGGFLGAGMQIAGNWLSSDDNEGSGLFSRMGGIVSGGIAKIKAAQNTTTTPIVPIKTPKTSTRSGGGRGGHGGGGGGGATEVVKTWTNFEDIINGQQIADNLAIIAEKSKTATADQIADLHLLEKEWENYQRQWDNIGLTKSMLDDVDIAEWAKNEFSKLTEIPMPKLDLKPVEVAGTKTKDAWQDAARAVGAVGSALSQLDDPSMKVAGIVGQAVANIALGFAEALKENAKTPLGVWGWIAAAASGLGTMISTISAIKSATAGSYEQGGIVPGNSYHGDNLMANVNSGELILNTAQQSNVAAALQSSYQNNQSALGLGVRVRGEDLFTALDNYQRRTGKRFSA